jgi:hypothetical protein
VQVVDCRRILKWTYAYGYYRFGEHAIGRNGAAIPADTLKQQQEFFEFNQVRRAHMQYPTCPLVTRQVIISHCAPGKYGAV